MKNHRNTKTPSRLVWLVGLFGFGAFSTAYVDPGSGSFLIQVVVASLLGAGLLIRVFWTQIMALFGRKPKAADDASDSKEE